jgi:hypothetical protein
VVPWLRLEPVGQPAQYDGQLVPRTAGTAGLRGGSKFVALGPYLGGAELLGEAVARYLLVFGDHRPCSPHGVPVLASRADFGNASPRSRRVPLPGGTFWVVWIRP